MFRWAHLLPMVVILLPVLLMHLQIGRCLRATAWSQRSPWRRRAVWFLVCLLCAWLIGSMLFSPYGLVQVFGKGWLAWMRAAAVFWVFVTAGAFMAILVWRRVPRFDPNRRRLLQMTSGALAAAPFAATAFGFLVERLDLQVREIEIAIPDLPKDLEGLRLVQLSDIHLSPFLSERELAAAVDMANDLHGHVALVTGDLITSRGDPLDACLRQVARLRADAGILGCLGNHEGYAGVEGYTTRMGERLGIRFLRGESRQLRFGNESLNFGGVDYQSFQRPYLENAAQLVRADMFNILLSHNPDVFPVAAQQGWDLTISGHTHGGQVNVEIFDQSLNIARFYTPFVYGVYGSGVSSVYVTRGIGTVGIPARIGAPPEIALIRLTQGPHNLSKSSDRSLPDRCDT